ncbi:3-hydroxyacyl-CoA dehydrogenase [Lipomyces arxii]|uniref:3-hydroxyacyl-CoA dehydrogenase n=1 Tax=Lipomyces arxii TaxID=56418 RepID=UPI0034CE04D6
MGISGKTFIVSGGAAGLGLATVQELVSRGAHVAVLDRNTGTTKQRLESASVQFFTADVADESNLSNAVDAIEQWTQTTRYPLGGLVSAAGVSWASRTIDRAGEPASLDMFRSVVDINLVGTYSLSVQVAAKLAKLPESALNDDGERGVIILVASVAAYEGQTGQVAYAASKGGVASLVLPMARDLAPWGIRVVGLAPGVFETNMTAPMPLKTKKKISAMLEFPRRFGQPVEFAKMAAEVIENGIVNGTVIRLDGASRMGKL